MNDPAIENTTALMAVARKMAHTYKRIKHWGDRDKEKLLAAEKDLDAIVRVLTLLQNADEQLV